MATAEVYLTASSARLPNGGSLPLLDSNLIIHEVLTLSGTSQPTTAAVPSVTSDPMVWAVTARGGDLRVIFGPTPEAIDEADGGWLVRDGETIYRRAMVGHKAAVITSAA